MIFVINPGLFNYSMKMVNPFTKIQLHTLDGSKRVCTIMTDAGAGEAIDTNYVNIKTRSGKVSTSGETEVLVRSCSTNKYDGNFIIAAIPFNGVLLPTMLSNFRFRYAEVVTFEKPITPGKSENYPEGLRYIEATDTIDTPDKVLYCVIEPNTSVMFDQNHPKHTDRIFINLPFAAYEAESDSIKSNTNFRVTLEVVGYPQNCGDGKFGRGAITASASYAPRHMVPKVMSKLRDDVMTQINAEKNMPYSIYFVPEKKAGEGNKKNGKQARNNTKRNDNNEWMESGEKQNKYAGLNKRNKKPTKNNKKR